jgi:hypothetical protein
MWRVSSAHLVTKAAWLDTLSVVMWVTRGGDDLSLHTGSH